MSTLQDVRYGLRVLAKTPAATFVAIASLALGIAANSVIFSVVDALGMRPLRIDDPAHLLRVFTTDEDSGEDDLSLLDLADVTERTHVFAGITAYSRRGIGVSGAGRPAQMSLLNAIAPNFFTVVGVKPFLGRVFTPDEDRQASGQPGVVISYEFWDRWFGRDPGVVGKTVDLNRVPTPVIGVLPADFTGLDAFVSPDIWMTARAWTAQTPGAAARPEERNRRAYEVLARARAGVSLEQVRSELRTVGAQLAREYPATNARASFTAEYEVVNRVSRLSVIRLILQGIVGFVLLIACANVAGLLLGRAEARRREIAMRVALGAGRARLVRQMLTESLVLALAAVVIALLLAYWLVRLLPGLIPNVGLPLSFDFRIDGRVLAFAFLVSVVTIPVFGLIPALIASRFGVASLIKGDGAEPRRGALRVAPRNILVITQIALSTILLVAAGLLVRSYINTGRIDPGFAPRPMVIATLVPTIAGYDEQQAIGFSDRVIERLSALPGAEQVAVARRLPLSPFGGGAAMRVSIPGQEVRPGNPALMIRFNAVGPNFLGTLGTRILRGRDFTRADSPSSKPVVLISQAMARKYWPDRDPVGEHVSIGDGPRADHEIVGIVQDAKNNSLTESVQPFFYLPLRQGMASEMTFVVRVKGDPRALAPQVRRTVQALDRSVPMLQLTTIDEYMHLALFTERITAALVSVLGIIGLLLAMTGLYAVVSYLVARRTREIGIRMALGARQSDVVAQVVRQGGVFAVVGLAVGVGGSLAASRLLAGSLYGVSGADPLTLVGVSVGILATTLLASCLPARRAARIDPISALRCE